MKREEIGSTFHRFLREESIYEEVSFAAIKRVIVRQVESEMKEQRLSKAEMARRMRTSRSAFDRFLDPENESPVALSTLQKAATAVGRHLRLELI